MEAFGVDGKNAISRSQIHGADATVSKKASRNRIHLRKKRINGSGMLTKRSAAPLSVVTTPALRHVLAGCTLGRA